MRGPDIIFTNGTIYTVDDEHPLAEAVAVKDGKFMEVGSAGDIEGLAVPRTEVVDLGGAFAMPGFIDCHVHPAQPYLHEEGGALLFPVSFGRQQIAEAVAQVPEKESGRAVHHRRAVGARAVSERARQQGVAGSPGSAKADHIT